MRETIVPDQSEMEIPVSGDAINKSEDRKNNGLIFHSDQTLKADRVCVACVYNATRILNENVLCLVYVAPYQLKTRILEIDGRCQERRSGVASHYAEYSNCLFYNSWCYGEFEIPDFVIVKNLKFTDHFLFKSRASE